ncbi:NAD-dependent epimerase/dehydratase family protein [Flavobacterium silvisoli]|uniref:NAD-dependent epimerase/dehydratase family protein n=1 Tax=Flavobacterium silvisoli TaxID=2529433 RepID=A0A4Q9Z5H0_9FLAO|nr:NAD-dependent epimerase/dehydratase family protein [Flavobacterium silvisoli]TBX70674.1 NAD-dependent epimerase/dehydratase family protein [Flavobacterium silvisoli]
MILVTGGTGLVGAHLLLHLAEKENRVRAIYRQAYRIEYTMKLFSLYDKYHLFRKIEWVQADITDVSSLERAFEGVYFVYHCAALISYDPKDEKLLRKVNIEGTANIVNLCLDYSVFRLCHVSSIAALGDLAGHEKQITEETEWNPEAPHSDYALSKYGAEMEIWRGREEGLDVVIVNPGIVFGPGFWKEGSSLFFSSVKKGFPFYTKGTTGYVGVDDLVKIMIQLLRIYESGERYIVVAENLSFQDVIFNIADKVQAKKPTIEAKPWMLSLAWRWDWFCSTFFKTKRRLSKYSALALTSADFISNEKIKRQLNYEFQSMDSVIEEVVRLSKKPVTELVEYQD